MGASVPQASQITIPYWRIFQSFIYFEFITVAKEQPPERERIYICGLGAKVGCERRSEHSTCSDESHKYRFFLFLEASPLLRKFKFCDIICFRRVIYSKFSRKENRMANIIAVVWDFDKTLVNGYMEEPIFEHYGVDSSVFWREVNSLPEKYRVEQGVRVNPDTIYLNHFIHYAKKGIFKGLNNAMLYDFGKNLHFYEGVPEIFEETRKLIEEDSIYQEYDIKVEHYIVSTGLSQVIKGSVVVQYVKGIWGCELIEEEIENGEKIISEIGYTIDNTSKTRALFEINKGVNRHEGVEVNTKMPEELRRVPFRNMIYVADGPSDIPAFSLVNKNQGATFAIYPHGDMEAMRQVEQMRVDGRINMYAEADYREGTTAYMWICHKIKECAERIRKREREKISIYAQAGTPKHLT